MKLYVIRHAIAVEAGDPGDEGDSQRPLTNKGREKMKKIAQGLRELEILPDLILSSPSERTMETAKILAKKLDVKKDKLVSTPHLGSGGDPAQLIHEIKEKYSAHDTIAIVGHEPYLSSLISVLVSGEANVSLGLKKGSVCCLSVETLQYGKCAQMDWLLSPSQLVEIGDNG